MTDPESVAGLFEATQARFGRLDLLFNNAGGNVPSTNFGDLTWEQWRTVLSTNLDGMFLMANGAYKMMRDQSPQGGRIINNGSISAHAPRPGSAPYTASKHAVTGLKIHRARWPTEYGIACGQIDIGNAATAMAARMAKGVPQANGSIAIEPLMPVEEIGRTLAYMATIPAGSKRAVHHGYGDQRPARRAGIVKPARSAARRIKSGAAQMLWMVSAL